ncbi:MAG: TolC family protein [Pseudomonadota bacterium]
MPNLAMAESLRDAVRSALTSNPEVKAASAEMRASAFELLRLRSEYQPVVTAFGALGAQHFNTDSSSLVSDGRKTVFSREIGVEAEIVLFDGQRRANLVYANAARVDANVFRLLDASETMALNATEVYIDAMRLVRLRDAASRNVRRHQAILTRVIDLVEGGRLPLSDQLQAQDRLTAAQLALVEVSRSARDADARYERIIGKPRQGELNVPPLHNLPSDRVSLIRAAVDNSYRVRIANIEVDRAAYERRVVESDRKPRISFNAGVTRGLDVDRTAEADTDAFVGVRMSWILHQGGRRAQSRAADERRHKAISERNVAIREVRELAESSWNSYTANQERSRILARQLRANNELVTQFESEFDAGTRSLLDVLEIERARFEVRFEKISADAGLAFSAYRLLAAQSKLADNFGAAPANTVLTPDFESRALQKPTSVFQTEIEPLR